MVNWPFYYLGQCGCREANNRNSDVPFYKILSYIQVYSMEMRDRSAPTTILDPICSKFNRQGNWQIYAVYWS